MVNPLLASPGKNFAHVATTGTIMRFVRNNSQVYYDNLQQ